MRKYLLYIALSIVAVFLVFDSVFGQSDKPFLGKPLPQMLQPWGTIICFSDTSATTGFYRDLNSAAREVTLESSALKKQKAGGGYRITFQGEQAMVFDEFMNETYEFIVYERRTDGVILIRSKGVGVEVITIDPVNGSFVLTDAGVQTLWNRANVWTGRCK